MTLEVRALKALYRNHPLTAPSDRYGEKARRHALGQRMMLLEWAATLPDYRLLDCRNLGVATLAWIREHQPPWLQDAPPLTLPTNEPDLDVPRLRRALILSGIYVDAPNLDTPDVYAEAIASEYRILGEEAAAREGRP